jgi:hypothetical protein
LIAGASWAQRGAVEIGVDVAVEYDVTDSRNGSDLSNVFQMHLPRQALRIGAFMSERMAFEASFGLNLVSVEERSLSTGTAAFGFVGHADGPEAKRRLYGRIEGNLFFASNGSSTSWFGVAGEVGLKNEISGPFLGRIGVGIGRRFETDDIRGATTFFARFGFSFLGQPPTD